MRFHLEIRNGFGFDLEVTSTRPVALRDIEKNSSFQLGVFDGFILLLPFFAIFIGDFYEHE